MRYVLLAAFAASLYSFPAAAQLPHPCGNPYELNLTREQNDACVHQEVLRSYDRQREIEQKRFEIEQWRRTQQEQARRDAQRTIAPAPPPTATRTPTNNPANTADECRMYPTMCSAYR